MPTANPPLAEAVGYMGIKAVHTPNLDKLAAKSQIFTNAHCQSPITFAR